MSHLGLDLPFAIKKSHNVQSGSVSTPFGRRPMTLTLVKGELEHRDAPEGTSVDKWRVYRDICEGRERLGVTDRSLAILNAFLSFYPEPDLSGGRLLIVFPSNVQLSLWANGISGATLRRHLAVLVDTARIIRNDSPNGKRHARRGEGGAPETAFRYLRDLTRRAERGESRLARCWWL